MRLNINKDLETVCECERERARQRGLPASDNKMRWWLWSIFVPCQAEADRPACKHQNKSVKVILFEPHILPHLFPPIDKSIRRLQKSEKIKRQNCLHKYSFVPFTITVKNKQYTPGFTRWAFTSYFAPQDAIKHSSLSNIHVHLVHSGWKGARKVNFTAFWFVVFHPVTFLCAEELFLCLRMTESLLSRK